MADFVHLHLHSEYSLLDGACRIADIPKAAKKAGHSAVAITDHGVMYGAVAFYKACKKEGIKPIIGCEVYVAPSSRFKKEMSSEGVANHLVLLCKNEIGYKNLIFLVSEGFLTGFYSKPRIDIELLQNHSEGLVALSACLAGYIPSHLLQGDIEGAEKYALTLKEIFGEDFYLEVQDHGIEQQKDVNKLIFEMSEKLDIPVVATNDCHYISKADSRAQSILMCIQTGTSVNDPNAMRFETEEFYYKSTEEMAALFPDRNDVFENTVKIADKCNFDFHFGTTYLPSYKCPDNKTPEEYLKELTLEGLGNKKENGICAFSKHSEKEYEKRIEYELSVIEKMGYSQYFLIVWDFVHYSKSKGIPVGPGRGSGAGSLVAYLIGITDVDPLEFDLLFERFLNPERVSMPDFDIDFCYNRRDEAISYVRTKYGEDRTSQIITFGTLAAKAAIRDVGRALDMPYNVVDSVAKLIPQDLNITIDEALKKKELKEIYDNDDDVRNLINISRSIEGMPRHASTHAAGVVITENPLCDYVPLSVNGGITVTQYDMTTIAELGLLKFDFLALRYLTVIDAAEKQIKEYDSNFSLSTIPLDDKETFSMISKGKTDGVFQLESAGMKQTLMQLKPDCLDDIIAAIALFRPGPMSSIPKYIEARHGGKREAYCTEKLARILDSTYGCIVYQEQVMQIFCDVAGYSLGHADIVRRAISKKHADELLHEKDAFIIGAQKSGVSVEDAEKLFSDIADFADYAFNKSHAAAYAITAYRTAYLKAHYLLDYNCALITSVLSNPSKIAEYLTECKKNCITVLPPDVNYSFSNFRSENGAIRFGLGALKNIGIGFCDEIVNERLSNGIFTDFDDFIKRMIKKGMNKRQMETLIKSGSLDSLGVYRSQMLAVYEHLMETDNRSQLDGQLDIFSAGSEELKAPKTEFPKIAEFSQLEIMKLEREASGMYLSGSILDGYSENIELLNADSVSHIIHSFKNNESSGNYKEKQTVTVCGVITARSNKTTKKGDMMSFVTLESADGEIEVLVFPKIFAECSYMLLSDSVIAVTGQISIREEEDAKILASEIILLSENGNPPELFKSFKEKNNKLDSNSKEKQYKVYLKVKSKESAEFKRVSAFINIFSGIVPVVFYFEDTKKYSALSNKRALINDFTLFELKEILGENSVIIK